MTVMLTKKAMKQALSETLYAAIDTREWFTTDAEREQQEFNHLLWIVRQMQRSLTTAREEIVKFAQRLNDASLDPAYFLASSRTDNLFKHAARVQVLSFVLADVPEVQDLATVKAWYQRTLKHASETALRMARSTPSKSTSQASNMSEEAVMAVWASIASGDYIL